jgi:hypothetical protein
MPLIFTTLFSGLWSGVKRLFGMAVAYPWQAAIVVSLCLSLWLYQGKERALATVAKRDATIVQLEAASKIATAAQIALNKQVTDKQTEIARLTDENETNRRSVADRSNDYAGRMRAEDYCRKTSATAKSGIAQSGDGQSANAIVVSRADFDILTGNTARLMDVKAWGDDLIGAGLAVPAQ